MAETMTYDSEIRDTLERLARENGHIRSFGWFLDCAKSWFELAVSPAWGPKVAVLGPGVPEELILAAGAVPYSILGGSLKSTAWSDSLVPRDTDPVSRSVLGFLHAPEGPDYESTLIIVPVAGDSMRKIAYLLKEQGFRIHTVDVPPDRRDPMAREKWREQMRMMTAAVARHTHTHVSAGKLTAAIQETDYARSALREFLTLIGERPELLTGSARLLVQSSYYYAADLPEWTARLRRLNADLRSRGRRYVPEQARHPGVLLLGSPVYFPNYKVPFLLEDIGLDIRRSIDVTSLKQSIRPGDFRGKHSRDTLLRYAADRFLKCDGSPAYTVNDALYRSAVQALRQDRIEGVVFHVLKGQIEYDFELERLEGLFDAFGVPVFRLETDYQYQDVEQLRIRMEAFSEMLTQNRYREERMAQ